MNERCISDDDSAGQSRKEAKEMRVDWLISWHCEHHVRIYTRLLGSLDTCDVESPVYASTSGGAGVLMQPLPTCRRATVGASETCPLRERSPGCELGCKRCYTLAKMVRVCELCSPVSGCRRCIVDLWLAQTSESDRFWPRTLKSRLPYRLSWYTGSQLQHLKERQTTSVDVIWKASNMCMSLKWRIGPCSPGHAHE